MSGLNYCVVCPEAEGHRLIDVIASASQPEPVFELALCSFPSLLNDADRRVWTDLLFHKRQVCLDDALHLLLDSF